MSPQSVHQFAEKVSLISDASSPIGRAAAMQLALQGSFVIGLFPSGGEAAVNELVELGTLADGFAVDASGPEGSKAAADEVERLFGRLDLLVNCLKHRPESSFEAMSEPDFAKTVSGNLSSAYFLTHAVLGLMKGRPKPKIVNVISAFSGHREPLFDAMQSAIAGLTSSLANELPKNFRVNCVEVPGGRFLQKNTEQLLRDPDAVAPDDAARVILFLLSSESISLNGQVLRLGQVNGRCN